VTSRRIRITTLICGGALTIGGAMGALGFTASAAPGDPTAEECAVIAAQAVINNRTPQAQLIIAGGGTCVFAATTTTAATVLAATAVPKTGLPKTGSDVRYPLAVGAAAITLGGAIVLINRRRSTIAT
jgi:LPXTG-motif cell wall-anchored protein